MRLETKQEQQHDFNEEVVNRLKSIDDQVGVISAWVGNKTGFVSGIIFCIGIIGATLGAMSDHIWKYITGHQ